jgi:hypothetical protein
MYGKDAFLKAFVKRQLNNLRRSYQFSLTYHIKHKIYTITHGTLIEII